MSSGSDRGSGAVDGGKEGQSRRKRSGGGGRGGTPGGSSGTGGRTRSGEGRRR